MDKNKAIIKMIKGQGLIPLYFHPDTQTCIDVMKALYAGGVRVVEFTNRGAEALDNFEAMLKVRDKECHELLLGIGTIKTKKDAKAFMKAGADFIIAPGIIEEVAETVHKEDMLWIPGCMTTTEIMKAEQAGASLIKLFPGNLLGPGFMSAIRELFPELLFMPTGGVEAEKGNLSAWFKSGVCAVGMGSKLITKSVLEEKKYDELTAAAKQALQLISEVR
ncbi:bifunctional 4-hydroxy-2-oxoglutarate aldolase/2-dehydro-3-deoxy-phosphogluconate aldolase [Pseudoflavitalea sp. G-6-1-2]|uniref:bifunctional 4-hydroxy-2-oxoglutarate aldolase/2-dehydro-3-deoxy-phosphogluconate aldolase n=1 Tax=Pseudoflavitalea sp. G-6-1-2 TaxID=2728841 RepID=UPI00146CB6E3|nr:bifunctional 4-hydroxy-2-oxoglutarate aldolase/2-dehydro-3-deoxy-phosphogluconate aldolase [Pseudoflavitalea sp. G-6-1-2]NML21148.1 bifunctional 4-hydroxy-2-oxoglutarate aldolase/2-dehydro-3-deoxy-phosphogluconate aldolase [Pseudoflavitalea sp. G-6-1-2]